MARRRLLPWTRESGGRLIEPFESPALLLEPRVDVEETDAELVVRARLPGLSRGDVRVEAAAKSLTLRTVPPRAPQRRHGAPRRGGARAEFSRRYGLPALVDPAAATATLKDGVLEIRLPRASAPPPHGVRVD